MLSTGVQAAMARATAAVERGQAASATDQLAPLLRSSASLTRVEELAVRSALAEAYLLQGDLTQAAAVVGRSPDTIRDPVPPVILSNLWRAHGRVAFARGEQSRAIALHSRALKQAEMAHDSRGIGLAHFCLGLCYRKVGDLSIVREHIAEAAAALHAAGDRRVLAQVHSLSATMLAQSGRYDEAATALRQAERMASAVHADDVLATVYGNQAGVELIRHRYDQALALAERAVVLQEGVGQGPGLSIALATLGQICVRLGHLERADTVLHRALDARCAVQYHETSGAVYDTLAQMSLMRGDYENAAEFLRRAADAFGAYGRNTTRWYEWSLRMISARLATRRGRPDEALALSDEIAQSPAVPPGEATEATLIGAEALLQAGRLDDAVQRLAQVEGRLDPRTTPGAWGEFLRLRGEIHALQGRTTEAYHDIAQSSSVFELVGERYQAAVSQFALARLTATAGARSTSERHYRSAARVFESLGATRDLDAVHAAIRTPPPVTSGHYVGSPADADDALVRRLVDAAVLPDLLARELATALLEAAGVDSSVVYVLPQQGEPRIVAHAGTDHDGARQLARRAAGGAATGDMLIVEPLGRETDGQRTLAVASDRPVGHPGLRRIRMMTAIARQGFELCGARERGGGVAAPVSERPLEPLLPGFVCASAAMHRVAEQIQRLQGNDLTVLITGESGTGKELIARAIHVGSLRTAATFLPYNCTTTTRELADSQLFGHRRGAFTGAVSDQPGLVRTADGGTLFLDEVGDLPLDVQPKLLRFLEQGEIMPVGETRPLRVDVRVLAATNADLEQRVAEGRFREDLYYRLSVIRIHVPPLRQRREEIPHLSTYFLREACERLGKADVELGTEVLDLFAQYWWPGNIRQLRNEVQRAVALAPSGSIVGTEHLSADLTAPGGGGGGNGQTAPAAYALRGGQTLASLVDDLERTLIRETLTRFTGNISESARALGLTRRGLYLKLRRLGIEGPGQTG